MDPWTCLATLLREVVEGVAPRVNFVRSSLTMFLVEPSPETLSRLLASLRSLEAMHVEEVLGTLRDSVSELHDVILEASYGLVERGGVSEFFDELVSIGLPPQAASEILYVLDPDSYPIVDRVAIAGARTLGIELEIPSTGEEYVSIIEDKLDWLSSLLEKVRDSLIHVAPLYAIMDAVLSLASRRELERKDLEELEFACRKLRAFSVLMA